MYNPQAPTHPSPLTTKSGYPLGLEDECRRPPPLRKALSTSHAPRSLRRHPSITLGSAIPTPPPPPLLLCPFTVVTPLPLFLPPPIPPSLGAPTAPRHSAPSRPPDSSSSLPPSLPPVKRVACAPPRHSAPSLPPVKRAAPAAPRRSAPSALLPPPRSGSAHSLPLGRRAAPTDIPPPSLHRSPRVSIPSRYRCRPRPPMAARCVT